VTTFLSVLCCLLLASQPAFAAPSSPNGDQQANSPGSKGPVLEDGTPVRLRFSQTVSSEDAHVNDRVEFEVLEEVKVSDVVVIPKGGIAWGTVTEAQPKRRMARGGKLEIVLDSVRLVDSEKASLRAVKEAKGGGHTGAMTAGIVVTGLLIWPAAPFFLFMHGKEITIPKGTEVPTFVSGNFLLDLTKFQQTSQGVQTVQSVPQAQQNSSSAMVSISSSPAGAEISIDQTFVGNTPSTISVPSGKHLISVNKKGYEDWNRTIALSGGTVNLNADLVMGATVSAAVSTPTSTASQQPMESPKPEPASQTVAEEQRGSGWIGVSTKDDASAGVVVTRVLDDSAGARAGLQVGDVIVELNGQPVKSGQDFDVAIARTKVGSRISLAYTRNGSRSEVTLVVGKIA